MLDLDERDRFQLFGGISQAFRSPNLSDLSRSDIALSGQTEVPSPGLSPEKYLTYEIGIKAQMETITASMAYFYTQIDNLIVRRPTGVGTQVAKTNGGDGYMQGIEFSTNWQINPNWSVFGHIAWVEGEADQFIGLTTATRREPLGKISPLVGYGGVRWQTTSKKVWTELVCLTYGEAARMNTSDQQDVQRVPPNGTPSFWLLTLRGGWQVNDHLILNAGVENMLNQNYRYHGSGSNEPGLGVNLGATVKF
jgi:hemoglobin/transferrin/lactoferrin receptor protein